MTDAPPAPSSSSSSSSGLACLSLGCDVLFTDMADILPYTEGNIRRNHAALVQHRATLPSSPSSSPAGPLSRSCCDSSPLWFGPAASLPPRVLHLASRAGQSLCVLCSECVFRTELHRPLAQTLHALLTLHAAAQATASAATTSTTPPPGAAPARCVVLVAFILREPQDLLFVTKACPALGLACSRLPPPALAELLAGAAWSRCPGMELLPANCHLYRVKLLAPPSPPPASDDTPSATSTSSTISSTSTISSSSSSSSSSKP
jgi:hypothetical protein